MPKFTKAQYDAAIETALGHRQTLLNEHSEKVSKAVADIDDQYAPLFDAVDERIARLFAERDTPSRPTPPNERPQES